MAALFGLMLYMTLDSIKHPVAADLRASFCDLHPVGRVPVLQHGRLML